MPVPDLDEIEPAPYRILRRSAAWCTLRARVNLDVQSSSTLLHTMCRHLAGYRRQRADIATTASRSDGVNICSSRRHLLHSCRPSGRTPCGWRAAQSLALSSSADAWSPCLAVMFAALTLAHLHVSHVCAGRPAVHLRRFQRARLHKPRRVASCRQVSNPFRPYYLPPQRRSRAHAPAAMRQRRRNQSTYTSGSILLSLPLYFDLDVWLPSPPIRPLAVSLLI